MHIAGTHLLLPEFISRKLFLLLYLHSAWHDKNYWAHTRKCAPGVACANSSCNTADKPVGRDVFPMKNRMWLNNEVKMQLLSC